MKTQDKSKEESINPISEAIGNDKNSNYFINQLHKSEQIYKTFFDCSPMALYIIDLEGIVLNWNQAAHEIFGWDKDEVIGKPLPIVPHEKQNEFKKLREIVKQGTGFTGKELMRQKKDGSQIFVNLSTAPLLDTQGKITSIMSVIEDITEKVQAQEQLKSNYQLLQMAGETAKFGGWSVDLEKDLCTWSDKVADIHEMPRGYSPLVEEGIRFYAPEWRQKISQVFSDCAQKGIPYDEEMQIITSQGKRVWVKTAGKAVRDNDGKIVRVQGYFQDISVQKEAQEALRVEREQLLALFDSIEQVIYVSDPHSYEILFVNRHLKKLFDEDPIGGICYQVFQGLDKPCDFCTNEIIFQDIGKPYTWEYYNPLLERHYLITDKAIRWIDDRDVRFEIAIDITKQKQAERDIINREKTISTLINATTDAAFLIEPDGKLLALNDELARRLGKDESELIGTIVYDSLPSKIAEQRQIWVKEVLQTGKPFYGNDEREGLTLQNVIYPLFDSKGRISMLAVYSRDITEQLQREHTLEQQRTTLDILLNAPKDTVALIERDGTLININKNGAKRFGKSVEEILGKNIYEFIPKQLALQRKAIVDQVFTNGREANFEDTRAGMFLMNSIYPVYDKDGKKVVRAAVFATDITERKLAEQELRALKDSLEEQVNEKTQELQERVQELERFHDATIAREIRMKELREEIKRLKGETDA